MRAAVFYEPNVPLKVQDWMEPEADMGEVVVRVVACGLCHTDLHYIDHGVPTAKRPPLILGHEATGIVAQVGADVTNVTLGDRVLLPAVLPCGSCAACRVGRENICLNLRMFGNDVDGAHAEYVKAPAKDVFILPDEIPLVAGCIIADAVTTPYHAVKNRAEVRPGDFVVVYGCGGVGLNVVQIARLAGGIVIAVDLADEKLEHALRLGATAVLNPAREAAGIGKAVRKLTGGAGADIALELPLALKATAPVEISSVCAVFAESEVINHLAGGIAPEDIIQGAIVALSGRAVQLMKRVGLEAEYALAGGMTNNAAMVAALEGKLGAALNLPPHGLGQLNGAFGAALLGLRRAGRLLAEGRAIPAPGGEEASTTRRWSSYIASTEAAEAAAS